MNSQQLIDLLILLSDRLEHLSVDSRWSRRASGLRGNILKVLSESKLKEISSERMTFLIQQAFEILTAAAREIPEMDDFLHNYQFKR